MSSAIAARTRERVDSSQELVASGAANVAAGLFQGLPVAGGFSLAAIALLTLLQYLPARGYRSAADLRPAARRR